jgi:uncharacterized protein (TIGR02145 family)/uncharacterized repeat protein (TIGR02543 family)
MKFFLSKTNKMISTTLWAAAMMCFSLATGAAAASHTVTIIGDGINAVGGGTYAAGAKVSITAGNNSKGTPFKKWTAQKGNVKFNDEFNAKTSFVMPEGDVVVKAEFGMGLGKKLVETYRWVKIGDRKWMTENMGIVAKSGSSSCYPNNNECDKYGMLYDWTAANDVCPLGWHLPTNEDWTNLKDNVKGANELKAKGEWGSDITNDNGFKAFPGGFQPNGLSTGMRLGEVGAWWSATSDQWNNYIYRINIGSDVVDGPTNANGQSNKYSVRCVMDPKEPVAIPNFTPPKDLVFDGKNKLSALSGLDYDNEYYTVEFYDNDDMTSAGKHTVLFVLKTPLTHEWVNQNDDPWTGGNVDGAVYYITFRIEPSPDGTFAELDPLWALKDVDLTLSDVKDLPSEYEWVEDPAATVLGKKGDMEDFEAWYTHPSGNYEPVKGPITVIIGTADHKRIVTPPTLPTVTNVIYNTTGTTCIMSELPMTLNYFLDGRCSDEGVDGGPYEAAYTLNSDEFVWDDDDYTSDPITFEWTITKAQGVLPGDPPEISTKYSTGLTLESLKAETEENAINAALLKDFTWESSSTSLNAGQNQRYYATYTDPSGNYGVVSKVPIIVNVAPASGLIMTGTPPVKTLLWGVTEADSVNLSAINLSETDVGTKSFVLGTLVNTPNIFGSIPSITEPDEDGYTWLKFSGAGNQVATATQVITIESQNYNDVPVTITFNAVGPDITYYSVTVANEEDATTDCDECEEGQTVTVSARLANPGDKFDHWETVPALDDLEEVEKVVENKINILRFKMPAEDVTVTAVFVDDIYTITFNPNNGLIKDYDEEGEEEYVSYKTYETYGGKTTDNGGKLPIVTLPTAERDGFDFDGWYTATLTGETPVETPITTVDYPFTSSATVYAKWEPIKYNVTWNREGHGPTTIPQTNFTYESNSEITPPDVEMKEVGWFFLGWYKTKVDEDTYKDSVSFPMPKPTVAANVVLHAKWEPKVIPVMLYNVSGTPGGTPGVSVKYGGTIKNDLTDGTDDVSIDGLEGTYPKHIFDGWHYQVNGDFVLADLEESIYSEDDVVRLWARWSEEHTITFNTNGAPATVVVPEPVTTGTGGIATTWPENPVWDPPHHVFVNWFNTPAATGGDLIGATTEFDRDSVLYARWNYGTPYKVTFTLADVSAEVPSPFPPIIPVDVKADGTLLALPEYTIPASCGENCVYKFNGWYKEDDTKLDVVDLTTKFTGNTSLQGRLTRVTTYTIAFDANKGEFDGEAGETVTRTTGADGTLLEFPKVKPTDALGDYKNLVGWFTAAEEGVKVTLETVFSVASPAPAKLYAHWGREPINVAITFNANGGAVTPASAVTEDDGTLAALPVPTNTVYYKFLGWFTKATDDGEPVTTATRFTAAGTIFAHWELITYTIQFNPGSGSVTPTSGTTGAEGKLASLPIPTTSATNVVFDEWYTAANGGGTVVTVATAFTANGTIYANWIPKYTVTLNLGGGTLPSGWTSPLSTGIGGRLASLPTTMTKANYEFVGWFTAATGGTPVTVETKFSAAATIYAQYVPVSVNYLITFSAGSGGSVSPTSQRTQGDGTLASLPEPTRSNYKFLGWFTAATNGTEVLENVTVFSGAATIYAHWKQVYSVTFNPGSGATVTPAKVEIGEDGYLVEGMPEPVRAGYEFDGWFTAATGGTKVEETGPYTADKTLYAHWTLKTYTIVFDPSGSTVTPASGVTGAGGKLSSLPTPAAKAGYTFGGWYKEADGTVKVELSTVFDADGTIYARWVPVSYTITYTLGGGVATPANPTSYTGDSPDITLVNPVRTAYEFTGWTGSNGTTKEMVVTIPSGSSGAKSFTANWTALIYEITFDVNGGKEFTTSTANTVAGGKLASLPTPTRDNYAFDGWFDAPTGGTKVTTSTVFGDDATIYAQWSLICKVTFNANGGTVTPATASTGAGGKLSSLPTPTLKEYTFIGWFTEKDAGVKISATTVFEKDETVYAHWTKLVSVAVTFSAGSNGTLLATVDGVPIASGALVDIGKNVVFVATPADGYKVLSWAMNGASVREADTLPMYVLSGLSNVATVSVSFEPRVSVASPDREIPNGKPGEVGAIAPVKPLSGFVTVGPNPVKVGGDVVIYWSGAKAVSGKLGVFNAVGQRVAAVDVRGTKKIGAWKTAGVAEGTYLVKGVLTDKSGVKVGVSQVVGVVR